MGVSKRTNRIFQFDHTQDGEQCTILNERDEVVGKWRNGDTYCLWQHNTTHRLARAQAKTQCSLGLSFVDRFDAGTEDLCQVGSVVKAQSDHPIEEEGKLRRDKAVFLERCQHSKREAVRVKTCIREQCGYTEAPQQQLHQNRSATHYLDVHGSN